MPRGPRRSGSGAGDDHRGRGGGQGGVRARPAGHGSLCHRHRLPRPAAGHYRGCTACCQPPPLPTGPGVGLDSPRQPPTLQGSPPLAQAAPHSPRRLAPHLPRQPPVRPGRRCGCRGHSNAACHVSPPLSPSSVVLDHLTLYPTPSPHSCTHRPREIPLVPLLSLPPPRSP